MKYARETDVPVERSKAEVERIVSQYGATGFGSAWARGRAMIQFEMHGRRVRFNLPLPDRNSPEFKFTPTDLERSDAAITKVWEQACRQRWRALVLAVKAKLEAVESGIVTFEEEFFAQIVLPTGLTIGETVLPSLPKVLATGKMPPLLPGGDDYDEEREGTK
jgi:hypothetical protein